MYVLCGECHNNYDDTYQAKKCDGPGASGNHRAIVSPPIEEHIDNVRATRRNRPRTGQKRR